MQDYINVVNEFGRIYRILLKILEDFYEDSNLPTMELLTLADINDNANISVKELAEKGSYSMKHLLFNINNLSRKNLIKTQEKSDTNFMIEITPEAQLLLKSNNIKLPTKLQKNINLLAKTLDIIKTDLN